MKTSDESGPLTPSETPASRGVSATETTDERQAVNEWLAIGASGIHGRGGYARAEIPAGTRIIEYIGEQISKEEASRRCVDGNPYIFTVNDTWDLDGAVDWNPARFLNHSCCPNCEAEQDEDRIWLVALRDIRAGEELTFNYGYDISEWREYPCACGSANCLGYIVADEFTETVRKELLEEAAGKVTTSSG